MEKYTLVLMEGENEVTHSCGHSECIYCKKCGKPVIYDKRNGLYCTYCGRKVNAICPGCGRPW